MVAATTWLAEDGVERVASMVVVAAYSMEGENMAAAAALLESVVQAAVMLAAMVAPVLAQVGEAV